MESHQLLAFAKNGMGNTFITADSTPDTPERWECYDWRRWHELMKAKHGKDRANELFMREWTKQGAFDRTYNFCKYDQNFVNYFLANGIDLRSVVSVIFTGSGDAIAGATDTVANTAKTAKYLVPVLLVLATGIGGYYLYTKGKTLSKLLK